MGAQQILALQRTAGNAAVARLLRTPAAATDEKRYEFSATIYTRPMHYSGLTSAQVLEAGLRKSGWPCSREKLAQSLASVSVDTKGLRGGPIEWSKDNHFRTRQYYRVYRWDPDKSAIVRVKDWTGYDVK